MLSLEDERLDLEDALATFPIIGKRRIEEPFVSDTMRVCWKIERENIKLRENLHGLTLQLNELGKKNHRDLENLKQTKFNTRMAVYFDNLLP